VGNVVIGRAFDVKRTIYKHKDINYIAKYEGISKEEVVSIIIPLLRIYDGAI